MKHKHETHLLQKVQTIFPTKSFLAVNLNKIDLFIWNSYQDTGKCRKYWKLQGRGSPKSISMEGNLLGGTVGGLNR